LFVLKKAQRGAPMSQWRFQVNTANDLDGKIRGEIAALDTLGRSDEIHGTVYVEYSDESVKRATLIPWLASRGVAVEWHKK
jgi:hypothetical protein